MSEADEPIPASVLASLMTAPTTACPSATTGGNDEAESGSNSSSSSGGGERGFRRDDHWPEFGDMPGEIVEAVLSYVVCTVYVIPALRVCRSWRSASLALLRLKGNARARLATARVSAAVQMSSVDLVAWAHEEAGCPADDNAIGRLLLHGDLEMAKDLHREGLCPVNLCAAAGAVANGDHDALDWVAGFAFAGALDDETTVVFGDDGDSLGLTPVAMLVLDDSMKRSAWDHTSEDAVRWMMSRGVACPRPGPGNDRKVVEYRATTAIAYCDVDAVRAFVEWGWSVGADCPDPVAVAMAGTRNADAMGDAWTASSWSGLPSAGCLSAAIYSDHVPSVERILATGRVTWDESRLIEAVKAASTDVVEWAVRTGRTDPKSWTRGVSASAYDAMTGMCNGIVASRKVADALFPDPPRPIAETSRGVGEGGEETRSGLVGSDDPPDDVQSTGSSAGGGGGSDDGGDVVNGVSGGGDTGPSDGGRRSRPRIDYDLRDTEENLHHVLSSSLRMSSPHLLAALLSKPFSHARMAEAWSSPETQKRLKRRFLGDRPDARVPGNGSGGGREEQNAAGTTGAARGGRGKDEKGMERSGDTTPGACEAAGDTASTWSDANDEAWALRFLRAILCGIPRDRDAVWRSIDPGGRTGFLAWVAANAARTGRMLLLVECVEALGPLWGFPDASLDGGGGPEGAAAAAATLRNLRGACESLAGDGRTRALGLVLRNGWPTRAEAVADAIRGGHARAAEALLDAGAPVDVHRCIALAASLASGETLRWLLQRREAQAWLAATTAGPSKGDE